jgi:hypothetical protein
LGLTSSFRNSLFYNRGKQTHSVTYTYVQNQIKSTIDRLTGIKNSSHQLQYAHLYQKLVFGFTKKFKQQLLLKIMQKKTILLVAIKLFQKSVIYFLKAPVGMFFMNYKTKKTK